MVLSNIATLLGCSPRELTDWFWAAYLDAYDWVVEPNVLAMGSFAPGQLMTTKPYVAGAAYIHRMSDYCDDCEFKPTTDCPLTPLYWDFLARNEPRLAENQRLKLPLASMRKRTPQQRAAAARIREIALVKLGRGERLSPADFPAAPPPPAKARASRK
jgi:deoxyribodipyrimidine photolyase-related protein